MKLYNKKIIVFYRAFTLIEIMVVIVIIFIITFSTYIPYNYYSNVAKVKISREIIQQSIKTTKNSSAGLVGANGKNQNFGLYFEKGSNTITLISEDFDFNGPIEVNESINKIKDIPLEKNVYINNINTSSSNDDDSVILYFKAPSGDMEAYLTNTVTGTLENITIGVQNTITGSLSKIIEF